MAAYYNEFEPHAAEWLRELIRAGHIADGEVDGRSIEDVEPADLAGFQQCHFFAGIGVWSYALRSAGWDDDREIWTGSCPCQPFSAAGQGAGTDDPRHLWPTWSRLIEVCRPAAVLGEQVASQDGMGWLDLVADDLEETGYAVAAADLCAAGAGMDWQGSAPARWLARAFRSCPNPVVAGQLRDFANWAGGNLGVGGAHIRQRLYFVGLADADPERLQAGRQFRKPRKAGIEPAGPRKDGGLAGSRDSDGNPDRSGRPNWDWLICRDGTARPVERGAFPLAAKDAGTVGRLRGFGNGLDAETARTWTRAVMAECQEGRI